jgi:hypothetical protein
LQVEAVLPEMMQFMEEEEEEVVQVQQVPEGLLLLQVPVV